jgi:hypothetical protein
MTTPDLTDPLSVLRPVDIRNISLSVSAGETYEFIPLVRDGELVVNKSGAELCSALIHWLSTTFPQAFRPARQAPVPPPPAEAPPQEDR